MKQLLTSTYCLSQVDDDDINPMQQVVADAHGTSVILHKHYTML